MPQEEGPQDPVRKANLGQPVGDLHEKVQSILSDCGIANGLDPVCAESGEGDGILPAAWRRDIWSDAGSDRV